MKLHANARTCPKSRRLLVERIDAGWSVIDAAEAAGISDRTARRWMARWRAEGADGLLDRSSAPKQIPHKTPPELVREIIRLRRLRMTAAQIATAVRMALSTVSAVLKRVGLGKRSKLDPPEPPNRYERRRPGELIHIDVKKLGRILKPGHRVTGDPRGQQRARRDGKKVGLAGWEFVHVAIDDHSRLAYAEVLTDEKGTTAVGFLERAIEFYAGYGVNVERVMTDNGSPYVSRAHAQACRDLRLRSPAHTPLPSTHQRQGRAVHPDTPTRVGLRPRLPNKRPPHRNTRPMAQPLQLHTTTRRPHPQATRLTTDQPS